MLNYITVKPEVIERQIIESPDYWWSQKLDGHFVRFSLKDKLATFTSKSDRALHLPHIVPDSNMLDGEYYCELIPQNGKSSSNAEVGALLKTDPEKLALCVFAANINGELLPVSKFADTSISGSNIFKCKWNKVQSRTDIRGAFDSVTSLNGEGIVVMLDSGFVYKIKPIKTLDLVVLGYSLGIGENAGKLRDLLLGIAENESNFCIVGRTSSGINSSNMDNLLNLISPLLVASDFMEVSSAKTAFNFIEPKIVAQFSCLDVQGNNNRGAILKPLLSFNNKTGYSFVKNVPSVSIHSMVFNSIREDKTTNVDQTGWNQILNYLEPIEFSENEQLKPSTIEHREVYSKESKNGLAIRKLIILKSNKESTGKYTSYNTFYSDFSPGRKSPLETEIYLHHSKEQALEKLDALREEYIKKGWIKAI